jgi:hypothetical protein
MFDGRTDIARYTEIGTLEQWSKEVADPAAGNSRLMFSESVGFAGPLADLLDEGSLGFHLDGGSSIGKTASLGVSVAVAIVARRLDQPLDLGVLQVLALPQFPVRRPARRLRSADCPVFSDRRHQP